MMEFDPQMPLAWPPSFHLTSLMDISEVFQLSFARIKRKLSKEKSPLWEISQGGRTLWLKGLDKSELSNHLQALVFFATSPFRYSFFWSQQNKCTKSQLRDICQNLRTLYKRARAEWIHVKGAFDWAHQVFPIKIWRFGWFFHPMPLILFGNLCCQLAMLCNWRILSLFRYSLESLFQNLILSKALRLPVPQRPWERILSLLVLRTQIATSN